MLTLGIDLAAKPNKTGTCTIDWSGPAPVAEFGPEVCEDRFLCSEIGRVDKAGIDVPFGWPRDFVVAVGSHVRLDRWPALAEGERSAQRRLSYRHTDEVVRLATNIVPLSVSTDKIAIPAMRWAQLEDRLRQDGLDVDRSGTGRIAEVYPAAALKGWGLPSQGYKGASKREALGVLFDRLCAELPEMSVEGPVPTDHALDALVSALVARAVAIGATQVPRPGDEVDLARTEGWIHLPTAPLRVLLQQ